MRGLNDCIKKDKNKVISEKEIIKKIKTYLEIENDGFSGHLESEIVQELLDLYNKQKEEIKELKLITNGYDSYLGENMGGYKIIIADSKYFLNGTFVEKYISKDKIKDIIKCLDHEPYTAFDAYGELLYDTEIDIKQKLEKLL